MMITDLPALMARGYLLTILMEGTVLFFGLPHLSWKQRLFLAFWLTAITYPYVWLIYPFIFDHGTERTAYLVAAEIFAPAAECLAYKFAFARDQSWRSGDLWVSFLVILVANLTSFIVGAIIPWWR